MMGKAVKPTGTRIWRLAFGVSARLSFSAVVEFEKAKRGQPTLTDPFVAKAVKILPFDAPEACSWQASTPCIESAEKARMSGRSSLPRWTP
jgi:hypothetical protein